MTQIAREEPGGLMVVKVLIGLAVLAAIIAASAGMVLLVAAPEPGSTTEGILGFTAAASGMATAVFAGAAAIYAQIRNLWQFAPPWVRAGAWALIVFAVISSLWSSITQMR